MSSSDVVRRKKKRKKRYKRRFKMWVYVVGVILILLILFGVYRLFFYNPVEKEVKMEVGQEITLDKFTEKTDKVTFVTDLSTIDMSVPGTHEILLQKGRKEITSTLIVEDLIAPTGTPVEALTIMGVLPEPDTLVTDIVDQTAVTVTYESIPDVGSAGEIKAKIVLTDLGGNTTPYETIIRVVKDEEAPVIHGAMDHEINVGSSISYKKGVTVEDNADPEPKLTIDNSQVDLNTVGKYEVVYTATDFAGNSSSVTITVSVLPEGTIQASEEEVMAMAREILDEITDPSMSKMEVAFEIYKWTRTHIGYVDASDKSSWVNGAYQGLAKRSGDCYTYFAAGKALFTAAEIPNVDIIKSDVITTRHYWSIIDVGGGYYHVDCTPRKSDDDFHFMLTDAELAEFSNRHFRSHRFDSSLYPARATESVQHMVNYNTGKIEE